MGVVANKSRTVILVDSHVIFLDGLTAILNTAGFQVVAAATSFSDAIAALKEKQPRLCVVEPAVADSSGPAEISVLASHSPRTLMVVLTSDESPHRLNAALAVGVAGYVHKTRGAAVFLDVISRVFKGEVVIEGSFVRPQNSAENPPPELANLVRYLTPRERECLHLLTDGYDTATMARHLGVSLTTVRTHVQAVLVKLGVHSRLEAAALATRYGLVRDDHEFKN